MAVRGPTWRVALGLACLTWLVWAPVAIRSSSFLFDDFVFIAGGTLDRAAVWTTDSYSAVGYQGAPPTVYRPLGVLWLAAERAALGIGSARPWHAVSVLVHGITAVLMGGWLLRLGVRRGLAAAAALIWALSPLHAETVGWAVGHFDLWATLTLMGALCLGTVGRVGAVAAAACLFVVAVLLKESSVMAWPALLGGAWVAGAARRSSGAGSGPGTDPRLLLGVLLAISGLGVLQVLTLRGAAGVESAWPAAFSPGVLLGQLGGAVLRFLGLSDLVTTAGPPQRPPMIAGAAGLAIALGVFAAAARRRLPESLTVASLVLLCVPGLVYGQRNTAHVTDPDRYFYVASLALPALACLGLQRAQWVRRRAGQVALAVVATALALVAVAEGRHWTDFESSLTRQIEVGRDSDYVRFLRAGERLRGGEPCRAATDLEEALRLSRTPGRRAACEQLLEEARQACGSDAGG